MVFLPMSPEVLRKPHRGDLEGNMTSLTLHWENTLRHTRYVNRERAFIFGALLSTRSPHQLNVARFTGPSYEG